VSWYQRDPVVSLELVARHAPSRRPRHLVDIGGGASTLVDHLLERGGYEVTVLDIAPEALEAARERLGERADEVSWRRADIAERRDFEQTFDVWHDRAVFHFLTDAADRAVYRDNLHAALADDGCAVVATFAPGGPEKCSGLEVRRWAPVDLADELDLELVDERTELHETPWGDRQKFAHAVMHRGGS
jgi:SAM-dependent methyltransferase